MTTFEKTKDKPKPRDVMTTAEDCLEALKKGDTSLLASTPADELTAVRVPFKDWMRGEIARVEAEYQSTYDAILAEMHRKGVPY